MLSLSVNGKVFHRFPPQTDSLTKRGTPVRYRDITSGGSSR